MQLQGGTLLHGGSYRIIETLGRGGFGVTYLAEQVSLHRRVCIKEFFPKDYYKRDDDSVSISLLSESFKENMSRFKAKFIKEAQTIATLNHANIIPIHDVFEENNTCYYVMEYIEGESLSERVKRGGTMSECDAVAYIRQVALALEHIHAQQIMHLDVKPGNVMVRTKDDRAILIDFGLSKHYDATSGEATSTTPVGVSHGYAPMEQYQDGGVSTFSPETDIYSLGATLYFLVTGNVPPQATVVAEQGLPYLDNLSSNIREAIEISMSYWRKDRPQSINDFLALLDGAVTQASGVVVTPIIDSEATRISLGDKRTVFAPTRTYKVGDYYNENGKQGVVFEVWDNGRHGKIVSLNKTKTRWDSRIVFDGRNKWFNGTKTGANSYSDGKANTDKVMSRAGSRYFEAFVWCRKKGADWYLPAKDELKAIYYYQTAINSTLAEYGKKRIEGVYWSSTEYEDDPKFCAWYVFMYNGYTYYSHKDGNLYVRAVSAF